jgi:hypothetical protein
MRFLRLASTGVAIVLIAACGDAHDVVGTTLAETSPARAPSAQPRAGTGQVEVSGQFDAIVDFATLRLTPRGERCLLDVDGRFVFSGVITGVAPGHTSALVDATCAQVASTPPGTDSDVFTSVATFDGAIGGTPAHATLRYIGQVAPGGHISAHLVFSDGVAGVLDADAIVAVGGTYEGSLVVH